MMDEYLGRKDGWCYFEYPFGIIIGFPEEECEGGET